MKINIETKLHDELVDITEKINESINFKEGTCLIFCPHTTAGLTINEGADPSVKSDILMAFEKIVPELNFRHLEGNSASHIKASIFGNSLILPVKDGKLQLGTWQSVFFCEFDGPRSRKVSVTKT